MSWNLLLHHFVFLFFCLLPQGQYFLALTKYPVFTHFLLQRQHYHYFPNAKKPLVKKKIVYAQVQHQREKKITQVVCGCILNVNKWICLCVSRHPYNHCCYANWQLQDREKPLLVSIMQVFMWVHVEEKGCFVSTYGFSNSKRSLH